MPPAIAEYVESLVIIPAAFPDVKFKGQDPEPSNRPPPAPYQGSIAKEKPNDINQHIDVREHENKYRSIKIGEATPVWKPKSQADIFTFSPFPPITSRKRHCKGKAKLKQQEKSRVVTLEETQ